MKFQFPDCMKLFLIVLICGLLNCTVEAQVATTVEKNAESTKESLDQSTQLAEQIKVNPSSNDEDIYQRLAKILKATGWFSDIIIHVEEGVVFLDGYTNSNDHRKWASELAGKVTDVVAVVNRIKIVERSPWDISPAVNELSIIWKEVLQRLPRLGLGLLLLVFVVLAAKLTTRGFRLLLDQRLNPLLRDVAARVSSILVFLLGFYLALQVAGLSGLSATVLGGTGIAGLIAGIAFRDLLENYLASILISIRNPFMIGDLIEIMEHIGIVEKVTTRGTVLMNLDGNHVQIPNALVYKSVIRNYTANPKRREMFEIGIGFDNDASSAQKIAMQVLNTHPAVLKEPETQVLVDRLGSATVSLRVYFWYDGSVYNGLKVKSSLIRLIKTTFEKEAISMPDEAREVIFPDGVPIRRLEASSHKTLKEQERVSSTLPGDEAVTQAEGRLESEEFQLRVQARTTRIPEEGANLLKE
ncbi:MAG: mechanosensitive ion channel family protein [Desulforhopalus sp.]